jgi:hypothetical protein
VIQKEIGKQSSFDNDHTTVNTPLPVPNSEAKHRQACQVLGLVTTWEQRVLLSFLFFFSKASLKLSS